MNIKVAEVRDIESDPSRSGRVKIRIYGEQNDEKVIPDKDLPWALPIQPITSAGNNRIGVMPHGLLVGSRVLITYLAEDTAQQFPIIIGSFSRAIVPLVEGIQSSLDPETGNQTPEETRIAPDHPAGII